MVRMFLWFLAAELILGFLALMIVLTSSDQYLQEGRRLLTRRGERVAGPTIERLAPSMMRLIVESRRIRSVTERVVVQAHRDGLALLRWSRPHLQALRVLVMRLTQRRHGIEAPARPRMRPLLPGPATAWTSMRSGGRGPAGTSRAARSRARSPKTSRQSVDGGTGHRVTRPKRPTRRTSRSRSASS